MQFATLAIKHVANLMEYSLSYLRTTLCKNQTSWEMNIFNPPSNFACS